MQIEERHCCLTAQLRKGFALYHTDFHKEIGKIRYRRDEKKIGKASIGPEMEGQTKGGRVFLVIGAIWCFC